jgi:NitT/TauT family transport system permease protein
MSLVAADRIKNAPPLRLRRTSPRSFAIFATVVRRSIVVALFCAVWETLPRLDLVDRVFLPPLSDVMITAAQLLRSGTLQEHLLASLSRSFSGLALAIAIAVPAGLAIAWDRRVADLFNPVLELFRNTAPLALLPVFTLILGIGEISKIAMVLYASTWPILLSTINGVRTVDPLLIKAGRSMSLGSAPLFAKIILPASVPTIFTGIRLAAAHSVLVLIAAEMVGAKAGLGYFVNAAEFNFQIPEMYAGIVTLALLGLVVNLVLVHVESRLSAWRGA